MTETLSQRLNRVERALKAGRAPSILTPLPGIEALLEAYGLKPNVDIYMPQPGESPDEVKLARQRLRDKRRYKRQREMVGEYLSMPDRRRLAADKALKTRAKLKVKNRVKALKAKAKARSHKSKG